jgi:polyisoprenoid-binding protein YceI
MKTIAIFILAFFLATGAQAQGKYFTKTGRISIYSNAPLEDIDASTKTAAAILDAASGTVQFQVLMKSFEFKKALMQEHFNSDYVESDKFPSGEFKGTIVNNAEINYSKPGTYTANVRGQLTMHGVTKDVNTTGTITVAPDGLKTATTFNISLSDFKIKRPTLVKDKVSNTIQITVDCKLDPLNG